MSTIDHEAFEWVVRKFARGLDDTEHAQFSAWYEADPRHQGAYVRALAIHNAIHLATAPQPAATEAAHAAENTVEPEEDSVAQSRRRRWVAGAMAAGFAAVIGTLSISSFNNGTVLTTAKGEFRKVPLQDKSIANINSGSQIEVAFNKERRLVNLRKGEAWFEVAKDKTKPFIVEAGDARVRAVGTAFAVRRFPNGTEVLVTEGTVEVWNKDAARRQLLTAGEQAFLPKPARGTSTSAASAISVIRQPYEVNRRLAWREGKLILKNQTLGEAVADFNRYSPKTIVILDASLQDKRLFGQYQLDAPELFAKDVSTILSVPLVITADRILIGKQQIKASTEI